MSVSSDHVADAVAACGDATWAGAGICVANKVAVGLRHGWLNKKDAQHQHGQRNHCEAIDGFPDILGC
jgi:hypothetical protein